MKNRVLFIFPNTANRPWIPSGIPPLAGIAKANGWESVYFDTTGYEKSSDSIDDKEASGCFLPRPAELKADRRKPYSAIADDLNALIDEVKPDLVAVSAMTCDYQFLMGFWGKVDTGSATVAIGGIHPTLRPQEVAQTFAFDLVCVGQGEGTFGDILEAFASKDDFILHISGTLHVDRLSRSIRVNAKRPLIPANELWSIPADYSLFDPSYCVSPFDGKTLNIFQVDAGRGCPYHCSYCGNSVLRGYYHGLGEYVVRRPVLSLMEVMSSAVKSHNAEAFGLTDECFLAKPREWLVEFATRYHDEIGVPFLIQTRAETVTKENLDILCSTGASFVQVGLGVESGSRRILREICDRDVSIERTIEAYDLMRTYPQIRTNAYYMVGLPTETREEMFETIVLCRRLASKVNSVSIYQPFPGQKLTERCIELGYITGQEPCATFTSRSVLKQPHITPEQIHNLWRCFMLYATLPEDLAVDIRACERNPEETKDLYGRLVDLRWQVEKGRIAQSCS